MDVDLEDRTIYLTQHIQDLFNGVTDENDSSINISPLIDRLVPVYFDSSALLGSPISPKSNRNTGYFAFYQSFSSYTLNQYNTLRTAFLEQILSKTVSLLPIATIANSLQLGDNRYDSSYESDDRLLILVGELASFYGSSAVDSFLHPLFKKYIFDQIHLPQNDQQTALQFENLIKSSGGIMDIYYQQLEVAYPQVHWRWECTITYQFGPKTPLLLHHRIGKNKKQAKLRTLIDIYNYYSRCDTEVVLYSDAWLNDHPHCHPQPNTSKTTLLIPTENMYEYDDEDYENTTLEERLSKQTNPNYIDVPDTYSEDPDGYIKHLNLILLGDDDTKPDNNDSPKASPLPSATQQQQQQHDQLPSLSALSASCDWVPSASSSPKIGAGPGTVNEQSVQQSPVLKKRRLQTTASSSSSSSKTDEKDGSTTTDKTDTINNALNVTLSQDNGKQTASTSPGPVESAPPTSALAISAFATPGSLRSSEEHLIAKATKLMDLFTVKDRCRLNDLNETIRRNPNDAKGCLKNLARKLDDGFYESTVIHVQVGKTVERAHYIVTVKFGTPQVKLSLARGHTKKTTAEGLAALAIFGLVEKVSKTINAEMKLPFLE